MSQHESQPITKRFAHLIGSPFGADFWFTIQDDGSRIPAHKMIVSAGSKVLWNIVYGTGTSNAFMKAVDDTIVEEISSASFLEVLRYLYTDQVCRKNSFGFKYICIILQVRILLYVGSANRREFHRDPEEGQLLRSSHFEANLYRLHNKVPSAGQLSNNLCSNAFVSTIRKNRPKMPNRGSHTTRVGFRTA